MNIIFGTINYDGSDMKNTPLIAALFFIMLLGGGGAAAVGADIDTTIGYDRSDYVGDFRIRCQISKDDLEAEKSWIISEQIDFPLPVHIAHALALEFIRSNVDVYGEHKLWRFSGAHIVQAHKILFSDKYIWLIEFELASDNPQNSAKIHVPVLISGKTARCKKSAREK